MSDHRIADFQKKLYVELFIEMFVHAPWACNDADECCIAAFSAAKSAAEYYIKHTADTSTQTEEKE